ncbi:MAG: LPS-assembly protein LptD [Gammaproteobacteria bacterium]
MKPHLPGLTPCFLSLMLLTVPALFHDALAAPGKWALCSHAIVSPQIPRDPQDRTFFSADSGTVTQQEIYHLRGKVQVTGAAQRLQADEVVYRRSTEEAQADGAVHYEKDNLIVDGTRARLQLDTETGTIEEARFQLAREHGRGRAQHIFLEGSHRTTLQRTSYTTCDPGQEDWLLRARKVVLRHDKDEGSARHAWLTFKKVPVFYFPYVTFPLSDKRKSGFLAPTVGTSNKSGRELATPYYLNLAPNYDATITPDYFSRRGLLMLGEFRYLTTINRGQINLEYINGDKKYDDQNRGALALRHEGHPFPKVRSEIQYNYVSDSDYLTDYGKSLSIATVSHLPQKGSLSYQGERWSAALLVQSFQTVDNTIPDSSRPYQRLPQLTFGLTPPERQNRVNFLLDGELVNFQRNGKVSGKRIDLQPVLSLPLSNPGAYLKPSAKLEYTGYALSDQPLGTDDRIQRSVPLLSIDSGLYLEREYRIGRRGLLHTLEPRLFYLYVPRREQDEIPVFDTGTPDFNFNQLFRDNRFTSSDRVGDANQISAALTTRLLDDRGTERLQLKVGEIFYLQDRQVTLSGAPLTESRSDIVAEGKAQISEHLSANGDLRWDTKNSTVDKGTISFRYHPGYRRILNLSYRYRNDTLKQTDLSLLWPLHRNWHVIGRWNRDLLDDQNLETLGGFEYQNCCWKFNFLARRYLKSNDRYTVSYYLQMEFKGLTSVGKDMAEVLESGILGYEE